MRRISAFFREKSVFRPAIFVRAALAVTLALVSAGAVMGQVSFGVNRLITVSASSGCAGLRSVLSSLAPKASSIAPYVVQLEPGQYSCGSASVNVPSYVTLAGFGWRATLIWGSRDSYTEGVVNLAPNTELRGLEVRNVGSSQHLNPIAVAVLSGGGAVLREVKAEAFGSSSLSCGVFVAASAGASIFASELWGGTDALYVDASSVVFVEHSDLSSSGGAPYVSGSGSWTCIYSASRGNAVPELNKDCTPGP